MAKKKHKTCWNYRVVKNITKLGVVFEIREVYYESEKINGWSDPLPPQGETLKELKADLKYYGEAFRKPVLLMKNNKLTSP